MNLFQNVLREKFQITSTASPAIADPSIEETPPRAHRRKFRAATGSKIVKARKRLLSKYVCMPQSGMSCAVDTAWQKRGFDSITCKRYLYRYVIKRYKYIHLLEKSSNNNSISM